MGQSKEYAMKCKDIEKTNPITRKVANIGIYLLSCIFERRHMLMEGEVVVGVAIHFIDDYSNIRRCKRWRYHWQKITQKLKNHILCIGNLKYFVRIIFFLGQIVTHNYGRWRRLFIQVGYSAL